MKKPKKLKKSSWDDIGKYQEPYTEPSDRLGKDNPFLDIPSEEEAQQQAEQIKEVGKTAQAIRKRTPGISQEESIKRAQRVTQARSKPQPSMRQINPTDADKARDAYIFDEGLNFRDYMRMPLQFLAGDTPTKEERIQERIRYTDPNTLASDKFIGTLGQATELAPLATLNTGMGLAFAPANYGKLAKVVDAVSPIGLPTNSKKIGKAASSVDDVGKGFKFEPLNSFKIDEKYLYKIRSDFHNGTRILKPSEYFDLKIYGYGNPNDFKKLDYKDILRKDSPQRPKSFKKEEDKLLQYRDEYIDLITGDDNIAKAKSVDERLGTDYFGAINKIKRNKERLPIPKYSEGLQYSKGGEYSKQTFKNKYKYKEVDSEIVQILRDDFDGMSVNVYNNANKNTTWHEYRHMLDDLAGIKENKKVADELKEFMDINEAGYSMLGHTSKEHNLSPHEIYTLLGTEFRMDLVEKGILKNFDDILTNDKLIKGSDLLNTNFKNAIKDKDKFIKWFNNTLPSITLPAAIGTGAALNINSQESTGKKLKYGGNLGQVPENIPTWNYFSSGTPIYKTNSVPRIANMYNFGGPVKPEESVNEDPYGYSEYLDKPGINNDKLLQFISLGKEHPTNLQEAKLLAEATGMPSHQASVIAAQWALESGKGKHVGGNHNYFGIKSHNKKVRDRMSKYDIDISPNKKKATHEIEDGKKVEKKDSFLNFKNPLEAFIGYKAFVETNPRYKKALDSKNSLEYATELKRAGYATSPTYVNKLKPLVIEIDNSPEWSNIEDYESVQERTPRNPKQNAVRAVNTIPFIPDTDKMNKALKEWETKEQLVSDSDLYPQHNKSSIAKKENPEIVDNLYLKPSKQVSFGRLPQLRF